MAEYRNGNDKENHVRKVPGVHKVGDVTLKRGLIGSTTSGTGSNSSRARHAGPSARSPITLLDEAGNPVPPGSCAASMPMKYTGPTLAAKGGGDVAMEELVLSVERIEYE